MRVDRMHRPAAVRQGWRATGLAVLAVTLALAAPRPGFTVLAQAPGPELFAKEPRTPLELWDAIDYLLRTNQAKKALPYIDKFMKGKPDDATLIAIRNRYGPGSILRLNDDPVTRPFAQPLAQAMVAAARKYATRPERIARFISELTKTSEEQDYAIRHLREAGPDSIPFLVDALNRPDLSADERRLIVNNMGRLDRSVIPALAAVLDSPDPTLRADAARVLGRIGNKEAVPFLTFYATFAESAPPVRAAAQEAIARLTGQPFATQPRMPIQVLTDAAWRYHRHSVEFLDDPVEVWTWDAVRKAPVVKQVPKTEAEAILGLRLANQALKLDSTNRNAQTVRTSLLLEKAIERVGFNSFPTNDPETFTAAKASGPSILSDVLKTAIADGKSDLAAAAATALGQVTDRAALSTGGQLHPLVEALYAPGRRVQFAAARALVTLAPTAPFPGSSRIVPVLARFINNQALSRAVVIDSNPTRGSQLAGLLLNLGYDSELEQSGAKGFLAVAETADVELILISYDLFRFGWSLNDTLANLGADSRTAAVPVFVYGPLNVQYKRPNLNFDYPGIRFLVQPVDATMLSLQLKGLPTPLADGERASYAREGAGLLARIATEQKEGPLTADLPAAELSLAVGLGDIGTSTPAITALGEVPDPDAQRSLMDVVLDPSRTLATRQHGAAQVVRSIGRFGPLVSADQEARLVTSVREETDPDVRAALTTIVRALRPPRIPALSKPTAITAPAASSSPVQTPPLIPPAPHQPGAKP
jgi:HEAT repeats